MFVLLWHWEVFQKRQDHDTHQVRKLSTRHNVSELISPGSLCRRNNTKRQPALLCTIAIWNANGVSQKKTVVGSDREVPGSNALVANSDCS